MIRFLPVPAALAAAFLAAPPAAAGKGKLPFSLHFHPPGTKAEIDSAWLEKLRPFVAAGPIAFVGWAPQGMLVQKKEGDLWQLFQIREPEGSPRRVSRFTRPVDGFYANPVPEKKLLLLTRDAGGDEQFRLFLYRWENGGETPWPMPPGRATGMLWNRRGEAFAYAHIPAGSALWTLRLGIVPGKKSPGKDTWILRARRPGGWTPLDFSQDGKFLLARREVSASESELWLVRLADRELTRLLPKEKPQSFASAFFLPPSGRSLSIGFVSDRGGEFQGLYRFALGDDAAEPLVPPPDWDVEWADADPRGEAVLYAVNEGGASRLFRLDLASGKADSVSGLPQGVANLGRFHPSGTAGLVLSGSATPGETWVVDSLKARLWAAGDSPGEEGSQRLIRFPTFDSAGGKPRELQAWLRLPPGLGPHPVLIHVHGGPEMQARPAYDPFLEFCARKGIAVLRPNVRGSTGYGRTFQRLDDGRRRADAVRDLGALLEWIARQPSLDMNRVAIQGRSYGGFLALAALTRYGNRIQAGISGVGISHLPSFLESTAGYRRDLRRAEYGDERQPETRAFLDSLSPRTHAARIKSPLLLTHGRNDPRVPLSQSEEMFAALARAPSETWLLVLDGEGHGLRRKSAELWHQAVAAQFLAKHFALSP